jgi:hypothetical protein
MEGGMVGIDIGFDRTTAVGILCAVEGMVKALAVMDTDNGIEEFERYQVQASLCNWMRSYGLLTQEEARLALLVVLPRNSAMWHVLVSYLLASRTEKWMSYSRVGQSAVVL